MKASPKTLERLCTRKLGRWGLVPHLRGGQVFICEPRRMLLELGDFWSIFEYDEEIRMMNSEESVTNVLWNRRNPFDLSSNPYMSWLEDSKKDGQRAIEDQKDQIIDVLKHAQKIQVQV